MQRIVPFTFFLLLTAPFKDESFLNRIEHGGPVPSKLEDCSSKQVVSWNIERGRQLPAISAALRQMCPSIVLLQEVDLNAGRTGGKNIAAEIAKSLNMNYLFAAEFEELGHGSHGKPAYHGQAVLTTLSSSGARILRFKNQTDFWQPRWYLPNWSILQRRIGGRMALVAELGREPHRVIVYNVHLESRGSEDLRLRQIQEVIADAALYPMDAPILLAGDLNTRLAEPPAVAALVRAGFRKAAGQEVTTKRGQALDWIFVRGPVNFTDGRVHLRVDASDHFPLSLTIRHQSPACP